MLKESKKGVLWLTLGCLVVMFIVGALGAFIFNEKQVTIYVDGEKHNLVTTRATVAGLLKENNITVAQSDLLIPEMKGLGLIEDQMTINIVRGTKVLLLVDGEIRELTLPLPNVQQVLLQEQISLGPKDMIEAVLAPAGDNDQLFIKVTRLREATLIEEEEIAYTTRRQPDYRLMEGKERVVEEGTKGLLRREVQVIYMDDKEHSKEIVREEVVQKPKQRLVVYGTGKTAPTTTLAARGSLSNLSQDEVRQVLAGAKDVITMESTAYTHTGNRTATGIMPYVGVVAVDPKIIPLGSKLYVEGYGFGLAADTGGAIKGNIVDVFMDTRKEAINWGRRNVKVYILE